MQTHGPDGLKLEDRFCEGSPRINSIHHYLRHHYFAYTWLVLLACVLCASAARSQTTALAFTPSPGNVGSVAVGSAHTISVTLRNASRAPATISKATVSATGFSISGLAIPFTISAGGSVSFVVKFAPTS